MMSVEPQVLDDLIRRIVEVVRPCRVILFGSAVREEMRPDSDLDVLVVVPDGVHRRRTAQRIHRNLVGFALPTDVVVATEGDLVQHGDNFSLVYYPALREGEVIYAERPTANRQS